MTGQRQFGSRGGNEGAVPTAIVDRLRPVCLGLAEAYEEQAWVGTRWRVRGRTFAHVLGIAAGWPPVYARAAGTGGPALVLMFRSAGPELEVLRRAGHPYFAPPWRPDEIGLILDDGIDWTEVAELIIDSYCVLAPKKLAGSVDRPPESSDQAVSLSQTLPGAWPNAAEVMARRASP